MYRKNGSVTYGKQWVRVREIKNTSSGSTYAAPCSITSSPTSSVCKSTRKTPAALTTLKMMMARLELQLATART